MDVSMDEVMLWLAKELSWHDNVSSRLEYINGWMSDEDFRLQLTRDVLKKRYLLTNLEVINELIEWASKPYALTITEADRSDGTHRYTFDAPFATVYVRHPDGTPAISREEVESILPKEVKVEYKGPVFILM